MCFPYNVQALHKPGAVRNQHVISSHDEGLVMHFFFEIPETKIIKIVRYVLPSLRDRSVNKQ